MRLIIPRAILTLILIYKYNINNISRLLTTVLNHIENPLFLILYSGRKSWLREKLLDDLYALEELGFIKFDGKQIELTSRGKARAIEFKEKLGGVFI